MQDLFLQIPPDIVCRSEQLQHLPAVKADANAGPNFSELPCLFEEGDGDVWESGERDGRPETTGPTTDNGDAEGRWER
jgi:hypothetical protein